MLKMSFTGVKVGITNLQKMCLQLTLPYSSTGKVFKKYNKPKSDVKQNPHLCTATVSDRGISF